MRHPSPATPGGRLGKFRGTGGETVLQERGGHSSFSFAAAHPSTPSSRWWPPQPSRQTPARASDTDMGIPGHEGQGRQQARGSGGRCRPAGEHRLASRAMKAGQAADNSTGWVPAKARRGTVVGRHAGVWEGTGWPAGRAAGQRTRLLCACNLGVRRLQQALGSLIGAPVPGRLQPGTWRRSGVRRAGQEGRGQNAAPAHVDAGPAHPLAWL